MIIALFPNEKKNHSFELAKNILEFFEKQGVTVVAEDEKAQVFGAKPFSEIDLKKIDFLISMGGDGTLLRIAHQYSLLEAPILGINLGHLGFMADVPISDVYPSLSDLLKGNFTIDERLVLEAKKGSTPPLYRERLKDREMPRRGPEFESGYAGAEATKLKKFSDAGGSQNLQQSDVGRTDPSITSGIIYAVNDVVLHRAQNYSLIEISIHVDGVYVNTFVADGIIISTPTGSTAYGLAAGGPILSPYLNAVAITPICPHTISNRPIVLSSDVLIEVEYLSLYDPIDVRADGLAAFSLSPKEKVTIHRSMRKFKIVNLNRHEYYSTLRSKLGWSGKLR